MRAALLRLLVAAAATVVAVGAAEVVVRVVRPGLWERPTLRSEDGEVLADLMDVVFFLRSTGGEERSGPGTLMKPGIVIRGCYDRPRWDYFDDEGCVEYAMNAFGFRDDPFPLEPVPGELRVLTIGDSFTFGLGVAQDDTWPQVLERRLAAVHDGPVQVINGGFAHGHMPSQYVEWLETDGLAFSPSAVIVGVCLNDLGPIPMMAAFPEDREPSPLRLVDVLRHRLLDEPVEITRGDYVRVIHKNPRGWQGTQRALRRMSRLCEERGVRFVVAVLPMMSGLTGHYPYGEIHRLLVDFGADEGIEVVDTLPGFRGRRDTDLWVHPTDQHPNDVGQRLIGEAVFAAWQDHGG